MRIPKEIAKKVSEYQITQKKAESLYKEVVEYLKENTDADAVDIEDIFISDKPTGKKQSEDGEYCEQHEVGYSGDSFYGKYYHKIDESDKYLGYHYSC